MASTGVASNAVGNDSDVEDLEASTGLTNDSPYVAVILVFAPVQFFRKKRESAMVLYLEDGNALRPWIGQCGAGRSDQRRDHTKSL